MSELDQFAVNVEAAFTLIGGEKSKATYDWMIAAQERERIINLLTEHPLSPLVWREGMDNSILMPKTDFIEFIKGEN